MLLLVVPAESVGTPIPSTGSNVFEITAGASLSTVLSNLPNNSIIRIAAGTYPVEPRRIFAGGVGAINLFSKTNIVIEGSGASTVIDGSSAVGEIIHMTNCSGVTLRGLTLKGRVETNYTLLSGIGHVWGSLSVYAVENVTIERCRFIDGHDHGIHDVAAQPYWDVASTNNVVVRGNYFENFGSARTNEVVVVDGTAVVPTGWLVEGNEFQNCLRCVEPYSQSDRTPTLFYNCVIRSNVMINTLDSAILTAGSTNGQNLLIEGNYIYNEPGYRRRGTNIFPSFSGINLNGGYGHVIRGNTILEANHTGISIGGGALPVGDILIEANHIENVDAQAQGFGISTFASDGQVLPNVVVRSNTIAQIRNYALYLRSLRDSSIHDNIIRDVCIVPGAAIKLTVDEQGRSSNVVIRANQIVDAMWSMQFGIEVANGNSSIRVEDNCIDGALVRPVQNNAGGEMIFANRGLECAASPLDVIINEWMADNAGIVIDPADQDSEDWFEIKNLSESSVNLSGYFLSDTAINPLKFQIPTDRSFVVPPHGYLLVWADNESWQNSFNSSDLHTNFKLASAGGIIGLYAADGLKIDKVAYGVQTNDVSEGRSPTNTVNRIFMFAPTPGGENTPFPPPHILQVLPNDNILQLHFSSEPEGAYRVEAADKLDSTEWEPVVPRFIAISKVTSVDLPAETNSGRFFRVVLLP